MNPRTPTQTDSNLLARKLESLLSGLSPGEHFGPVAELILTGQYREAIPLAQTLASNNPDNGLARLPLATTYAEIGDTDRSKRVLQEAVEINPEQPVLQHLLGLAFEGEGDFATAKEHYMRALALDQSLTESRFRLGLCLGHLGDLEDAREELEVAVAAEPRETGYQDILAGVYLNLATADWVQDSSDGQYYATEPEDIAKALNMIKRAEALQVHPEIDDLISRKRRTVEAERKVAFRGSWGAWVLQLPFMAIFGAFTMALWGLGLLYWATPFVLLYALRLPQYEMNRRMFEGDSLVDRLVHSGQQAGKGANARGDRGTTWLISILMFVVAPIVAAYQLARKLRLVRATP